MIKLASDENFDADVVRGLLRRVPDLDIESVQDANLSGSSEYPRFSPGRLAKIGFS